MIWCIELCQKVIHVKVNKMVITCLSIVGYKYKVGKKQAIKQATLPLSVPVIDTHDLKYLPEQTAGGPNGA